MNHPILRICIRVVERVVTFVFALFCVASGLLSTAHAVTVSGKVINRADLSPAQGIQIIMHEAMCPVYGTSSRCFPGRAIDTAFTNAQGSFWFDPTSASTAILILSDADGQQNEAFAPCTTHDYRRFDTPIVLHILPQNGSYSVKGKAIDSRTSAPVAGIKAQLYKYAPASGFPLYSEVYLNKETISDAGGYFTFIMGTGENNAFIKTFDVGRPISVPHYYDGRSVSFSPFNDTSTIVLYLNEIPASARSELSPPNSALPIACAITQVSVSIRIPEWKSGQQTDAHVYDAKGVCVVRLPIAPNGSLHWDRSAVVQGMYYVRIPSGTRDRYLPLALP